MLKEVFGGNVMSRARDFEWHKQFYEGRISKSKLKAILIVFLFDIKGVIMTNCVLVGQTVNQKWYKDVLIKLRVRVKKKRPDMWKNNS